MKKIALALSLAALSSTSMSLPKVGYYKSLYSADQGAYECVQVLSNTSVVAVGTRNVAYYKFKRADGLLLNCIPQVIIDTDGTSVDGTPEGVSFVSTSQAFCTSVDGKVQAPVTFDATHIFWGSETYPKVTLPDGKTAMLPLRERQSATMTWYSATACP